jgi:hypothetical protein
MAVTLSADVADLRRRGYEYSTVAECDDCGAPERLWRRRQDAPEHAFAPRLCVTCIQRQRKERNDDAGR